jgi:hypothetical protein
MLQENLAIVAFEPSWQFYQLAFSNEVQCPKTQLLVPLLANFLIHRFLGFGERDRIRTCDPVIKSHLLYQLSYAPVKDCDNGWCKKQQTRRVHSV